MMSICEREWLLGELAGGNEHIEVEFRHGFSPLWLRLEVHMVASKEGRPRTAIIALRNISACLLYTSRQNHPGCGLFQSRQ